MVPILKILTKRKEKEKRRKKSVGVLSVLSKLVKKLMGILFTLIWFLK